ncbi:peptide-methionine (S)-S-oxide reductase MsrA [Mangrovimonas spongiae]|uniref:Peptide methionine sulfoxide reductase MsrA n=1 Tax=Mangrovimonas spongiae TaxID=2494697 RepID=A0A3R9P149_9FLAO|nr:peptide-methionine (S)-S-oxide reductase MsrA [Mangrovimonas spongiae]RSK42024.1 peptide-methionine (S)-S-oxide reductase [Mangrovimonas spongiae]
MKQAASLIIFTLLFSCNNNAQNNKKQQAMANTKPIEVPLQDGKTKAYFASGCFWCVEAIYQSVIGVDDAISGYSGGHTENPTYNSSNTGRTGHAEAVEVIYDPNVVSFSDLVEVYFSTQDPTQINGQGPDWGSQYRSIIFYQNEEQKQIAEAKKSKWAKKIGSNIAAEIMPFQKFWEAEAYHQNFEARNPNHPYVRNVSNKRLDKLYKTCPLLVKKEVNDVIKDLNKN